MILKYCCLMCIASMFLSVMNVWSSSSSWNIRALFSFYFIWVEGVSSSELSIPFYLKMALNFSSVMISFPSPFRSENVISSIFISYISSLNNNNSFIRKLAGLPTSFPLTISNHGHSSIILVSNLNMNKKFTLGCKKDFLWIQLQSNFPY